jgi:DNA replication protein DnaC
MATPYIKCSKCKDLPTSKVEGFYYTDDTLNQVFECDCHIAWRNDNIRLVVAKRNNIIVDRFIGIDTNPIKTYHGENSSEIPRKVEHIINNIDNPKFRRASVYLYGKTGTQKTHLMYWMGYALTMKGLNVYYTTMQHLLTNYIPKGFEVDAIEKAKKFHDKIMDVDVLIIDDFFTPNRATYYDWQTPHIDGLLRERLETLSKPVYFCSSSKPVESTVSVFGEATRALVDRTIKKTNTYLHCEDVYEYIDDLNDLFKETM